MSTSQSMPRSASCFTCLGATSTQTVHRQNFIKMGVGFGLFWRLIARVRWEVGGGGGDGRGGGGGERKELRT